MEKEQFYTILNSSGLGTIAGAIIENERMNKNNEEIYNFNNQKLDARFLSKAKTAIDFENWKDSYYHRIASVTPQLSKNMFLNAIDSMSKAIISYDMLPNQISTDLYSNKIKLDIQRKNNNAEIQRGIETAVANDLDLG